MKSRLLHPVAFWSIFGCLLTLGLAPVHCSALANEVEGRSGGGGAPVPGFGVLPNFGGDGLTNMFSKSMNDLTGFVSSFSGPKELVGTSDSTEKGRGSKETDSKEETDTGFMGVKDPMDFFKLMLNPMEFMNRLAKQFKLDRGEFTQAVGRGMNFGLETALQPPMVCIKIIEKVFVPDACKLKFVCDMGKQLAMFKGQMPQFPDSYFEGASTAKALYDGASGRECEHIYSCEEGDGPKLKKEYAGLRDEYGSRHES